MLDVESPVAVTIAASGALRRPVTAVTISLSKYFEMLPADGWALLLGR